MKHHLDLWIKSLIRRRRCNRSCRTVVWPALVTLLVLFSACEKEKPPIKIGFSGGLTGRYSDLGTAGRNGVILAVEEINTSGGIGGRSVELITMDDRQDPEADVKVDQALIQEGVVAIIGHMTSAMTVAVLPLINKEKILMISPTANTGKLSGKDDWFFRVCGADLKTKHKLADYAFREVGMRKIAAIYDLDNRAYTQDYITVFRSRFEALGGEMTKVKPFNSGKTDRFEGILQTLMKSNCDGVLIAANALDTAMICQRIRKLAPQMPILSSAWAMTNEFIYNAGRSAEGVVFTWFFDWDSNQETYIKFKNNFVSRFGSKPDFAGLFAYEAAHMLFTILSKNSDPHMLRETILKQRTFKGAQGNFEIDKFGDARRRAFLITVDEDRFKTME